MADYGSTESGASLGEILGAAISRAAKEKDTVADDEEKPKAKAKKKAAKEEEAEEPEAKDAEEPEAKPAKPKATKAKATKKKAATAKKTGKSSKAEPETAAKSAEKETGAD